MKLFRVVCLYFLVLSVCRGQNTGDAGDWQKREQRYQQGRMTANESRAFKFEAAMAKRMAKLKNRASELGVTLPDDSLSQAQKMARLRYRRGSMSPMEMDAYEVAWRRDMATFGEPVSLAAQAAYRKWREEHPAEAAALDLKNSVLDAKVAAENAESAADEAANAARAAQRSSDKAAEQINQTRRDLGL